MANSLTAMSPTFWSAIMGKKLYKKNVYRNICSFREEAQLSIGQIVDRPYRADIYVGTYTKGTALTAQDITATTDPLTVNKSFGALIYVDDIDKKQNKWDAATEWATEMVERLSNQIDAEGLYLATSASDTVDYNDLDSTQTAGAPIVLTTSNVLNMFAVTKRKLDANNVDMANRFFVISPQVAQVLLTYLAGRESILGDKTGEAGNIGSYFGFSLFVSNNLTAMIRWTPTNDPSNAETLIINGVTFNFVTTIGSTAGNVLSGTNTATTLDALVALINAPATTTANGVAFTGTALAALQRGWVAVDGTTYVDIYIKGGSQITQTGTAEGTATYLKQINFAGEKGAADMVIQKKPSVKMADTISAGKDGVNVLGRILLGTSVFQDMKARIFGVEVDSSVF